jgi:HNH endonuclease
MTEKRCSKCGEWKLFIEFYKKKASKDGYQNQCKNCIREYQQANKEHIAEYKHNYHQENRDHILEQKREWHQANRDRRLEQKRKYNRENRDHILEYQRSYRQAHKEMITEYYRDYHHKNRDRRLERAREWDKANPEKCREKTAKRRALKKSTATTDPWELAAITLFYADCPDGYHVDHIIPFKLGGTHTLDNLQYLEAWMNLSKHDTHPDDWGDPRPISCRS